MDEDHEQQSQGVEDNMPLIAFDFFVPIELSARCQFRRFYRVLDIWSLFFGFVSDFGFRDSNVSIVLRDFVSSWRGAQINFLRSLPQKKSMIPTEIMIMIIMVQTSRKR